jgi:hypothetical protein
VVEVCRRFGSKKIATTVKSKIFYSNLMAMKSTMFSDVMLYSLSEVHRRFGETQYHHSKNEYTFARFKVLTAVTLKSDIV